MAVPFGSRVRNAWNAFWHARDPTYDYEAHASTYRPDRIGYTRGNERTIIASIFNRIATDVTAIDIRHVKLDEEDRFDEIVDDGLNQCLSVEANIDQTGRAMIHDVVTSLLDEGCIAIVPVDTTNNPNYSDSYDILSLRVAKITEWRPKEVRVDIYNDSTGLHQEIWVSKKYTAIIENPFYSVMNEPNSTMQRLVRKLNLLDKIDNDIGANKLDLIVQLPYLAKAEAKKKQANERRKEIVDQLTGSQYGVAWIDATEKITQLNRPLENTLLGQIEYLTNQVYAQLGMSQAILDGTADEKAMLNYNNRIVDVILLAISEEMERKFLSKTARTQGHAIRYFRDPFRLVPVSSIADIADKFTRNEILSSNEIRQIIGRKPSDDPDADELRNKNLNKSNEEIEGGSPENKQLALEALKRMDEEERM